MYLHVGEEYCSEVDCLKLPSCSVSRGDGWGNSLGVNFDSPFSTFDRSCPLKKNWNKTFSYKLNLT
jgi:hypothetical protein